MRRVSVWELPFRKGFWKLDAEQRRGTAGRLAMADPEMLLLEPRTREFMVGEVLATPRPSLARRVRWRLMLLWGRFRWARLENWQQCAEREAFMASHVFHVDWVRRLSRRSAKSAHGKSE